jgi:Zn finger protein HypA/HybF involved in hydrogenase expression
VSPTPLIRTLDQEVLALLRGASLECLVCGEFVQHRLGVIACPECGAAIQDGAERRLQLDAQAG